MTSIPQQEAAVSWIMKGAIENQKVLNIDLAKPTSAQQFPTTVNREGSLESLFHLGVWMYLC
ncbi:hypothetical protein PENARI_c039G04123 [Penicillium arizonense]|uniref:Uncharacterized protein n=1 Tax=Penicillium arizonense TaxID=1835702 RepID=A0A1F5L411_PENAI|nr:hypothetical protein PENARI_c039G04123 [Penicillium arizonense]OGE47669.1 hypothetical protein PENARI_c039G04123 [Penicillium arizonense]